MEKAFSDSSKDDLKQAISLDEMLVLVKQDITNFLKTANNYNTSATIILLLCFY